MSVFVLLGLVSSAVTKVTGCKERLWNDLLCIEWNNNNHNSEFI